MVASKYTIFIIDVLESPAYCNHLEFHAKPDLRAKIGSI